MQRIFSLILVNPLHLTDGTNDRNCKIKRRIYLLNREIDLLLIEKYECYFSNSTA